MNADCSTTDHCGIIQKMLSSVGEATLSKILFNYYWEEKVGNECHKYLKVMSEYIDLCQLGLNIFPTLEMQNRKCITLKEIV